MLKRRERLELTIGVIKLQFLYSVLREEDYKNNFRHDQPARDRYLDISGKGLMLLITQHKLRLKIFALFQIMLRLNFSSVPRDWRVFKHPYFKFSPDLAAILNFLEVG